MNFDKIQDQLFEATRSQNQIIFQETLKLSKLKNTWIAQIVTVSGTILGGVSVFAINKNIATYIGLIILFTTIVIGLILIIHNLKKESNRLMDYFAKYNDYSLRVIMQVELQYTAQNRDLTKFEQDAKDKLDFELKQMVDRWNILDENGNLRMFSDILSKEKVSIGNYILISGLAIGGLFITMAELLN